MRYTEGLQERHREPRAEMYLIGLALLKHLSSEGVATVTAFQGPEVSVNGHSEGWSVGFTSVASAVF